MRKIACLGDISDHGGTLISTNQDGRFSTGGVQVCANGCMHKCGNPYHGTTSVTAVTMKSYVNGKLIVTEDAVAGCGAKMTPPDRLAYVE